ncbi:MAG TPA: hypothetical protein VGC14_05830 [Rhizobium sp.]
MATKTLPWEYHPDLTEERVVTIARLIADARHMAVELFDEAAGDDGWTLGCRASQFGRARILRAAADGEFPWLGVLDRSRRLVFTIGEVPIRIYRGEADDPTERTLRQSYSELQQLSFSFDKEDDGGSLAYRYAIETDIDGSVLAIKFVGLRGESAILNWDVPLAALSGVGTVGRPATESVELDAPAVVIRDRAGETGTEWLRRSSGSGHG